MPTIAIVDGVRIVIYPKDHLPPHLHAIFGERQAMVSIATGLVMEGDIPAVKRRAVQTWLADHRAQVAHVWTEIRAGRWTGGRIDR